MCKCIDVCHHSALLQDTSYIAINNEIVKLFFLLGKISILNCNDLALSHYRSTANLHQLSSEEKNEAQQSKKVASTTMILFNGLISY